MSDHNAILWKARESLPKPKLSRVTVRPCTDSAIREYGRWIGTYDFPEVHSNEPLDTKVSDFNATLYRKYLEIFTTKSFVVGEYDKPWISPAIKSLIKERSRLYSSGDTLNGKKLRNQIVSLVKKAKTRYGRETMPHQLLTSDPKKWHNAVKKVAGQSSDSSVRISNDDGTSISAEEVNEFFTKICTTYPPITADEKSTVLEKCEPESDVIVSEFDVYTELRKLKPNTSSYPGELPVKLLREYAAFIALPLSIIINECFASSSFPSEWKRAYIRVIPKKSPPSACDDLRPISLTPCLAKVTEAFILKFLLKQVHGLIDKFQYGGLPKCSTTIYLVRMFDRVLRWLEKGSCFVDICAVDFRKAFDLIRHLVAGMNLQEMGAKRRTLGLVLDFLTGRKQKVFALHENDSDSSWSDISCGAPQGTKLAGIIFLAVINSLLSSHDDRYKFVDDLSIVLAYLVEHTVITKQFSDQIFDQLKTECSSHDLTINVAKSKIIRFNPLKRNIDMPVVPFPIVNEIKILGVTFTSDCSFSAHIISTVRKANASLQTLTKMRRFGCDTESLLHAYLCYVRPLLEYACPVWGPSAIRTAYLLHDIESVQKRATRIILRNRDIPYEQALAKLNLSPLEVRLEHLILQFGKSVLANTSHRSLLPETAPPNSRTRLQNKLVPPKVRTNRYGNSFVPFFTSAFNAES